MEYRVDTFANRLKIAMDNNNLNQVELSERTKLFEKPISQSLINKYLKGKAFARQNNIDILSQILNVNEAWLMGFDVSMSRVTNNSQNIKTDFNSPPLSSIHSDGLDEEDIEEVNRYIEFIKNKKKGKK